MTECVYPFGAIIIGKCDVHLEGVCLSKEVPGPVLVYHDETGQQINVCKVCAEQMFSSGKWSIPGESEEDKKVSNELQTYINEFDTKKTANDKLSVAIKYKESMWRITVPIAAGQITSYYWIMRQSIPNIKKPVTIAFKVSDYSTPAIVDVRPPKSIEEVQNSGGAHLVVEKRY
ncbi:hypothetical protein KJ633_00935 [bacterium]|nr:hypothetical protein [bacterium]